MRHAVDTRTFYVVPRAEPGRRRGRGSPDGRFRRSSVRPYPREERPRTGLHEEDVDGDGRILFMRMKDDERLVEAASRRPTRC